VRFANIRTSGSTPARSADASFLRRPESKMQSAHSDTGEMAGFIHVRTKLIQFMDTDDVQLQELTAEEMGYTDIIVNVNEIMYVFDDGHNTIIKMSNANELQVKESIHEVHQRIKRTTAFFLGQ
jgi:uncharacterized protein YlzI (FlbEa/FlbD family)